MKNLHSGERQDDIGFGNLRLIQRPEDFCYGIDAVLLADFAARNCCRPEAAAELGTGNGAAALMFCHKSSVLRIVAYEVQSSAALLAERNVRMNGLEDRIEIKGRDIMDTAPADRGAFDAVITNPPYMEKSTGITNADSAKHIARHETTASLEDFIRIGGEMLKPGGSLFLVHRPLRLADIFVFGRSAGMEPKLMRLVAPSEGKEPNIVLVKLTKGGGRELRIMPQLYVREANGRYSDEIEEIYERRQE
ncbi:MAG: methyltransferase [Eubacteriaceae bacterium]|nr:methyltransferase [Eubacteriaceae bacterium]